MNSPALSSDPPTRRQRGTLSCSASSLAPWSNCTSSARSLRLRNASSTGSPIRPAWRPSPLVFTSVGRTGRRRASGRCVRRWVSGMWFREEITAYDRPRSYSYLHRPVVPGVRPRRRHADVHSSGRGHSRRLGPAPTPIRHARVARRWSCVSAPLLRFDLRQGPRRVREGAGALSRRRILLRLDRPGRGDGANRLPPTLPLAVRTATRPHVLSRPT